jgi:hypothetical protein
MDTSEKRTFYHGLYYEITRGECPENPREQFDHPTNMVCWHDRYNLGDRQVSRHQCKADILLSIYLPDLPSDVVEKCEHLIYQGLDPEAIAILEKWIEAYTVTLRLFLYDHSGITMSTGAFSCPWDSGQVGLIYITRETVFKEFPSWKYLTKNRIKQVISLLEAEVSEYDNYLTGEVYAFSVTNAEGEVLDSCCGYYGDPLGYATTCAKESIDFLVKPQEGKQPEQLQLFPEASA